MYIIIDVMNLTELLIHMTQYIMACFYLLSGILFHWGMAFGSRLVTTKCMPPHHLEPKDVGGKMMGELLLGWSV